MAEIPKTPQRWANYWLSRSTRNGVLDEMVSVWLVKPERCETYPGNVVWFGWKPDGKTALHATWTIAYCLYECRVYPETDLELIRYGEEEAVDPKVS